ncbi:TyeA family type III secretion system gatekeeper subunit [Pseudomonas sp. GL-B-16]|uniref:TyeA family type III secretion system gatekeeper subunit n=1 Tax=Pseudomonas sp. GL-B-16 TaxID=2832373 RepID=UPI001CBDEB35|nr:TyeA family type III secretion system gatekeeper subunit [Pseudomonas sp. GL-B-16]
MKIVPPIPNLPVHLPPIVAPPTRAPAPPLYSPDVGTEEAAKTFAEKDARLTQVGQTGLQRDQGVIFNGLKSQAKQLQERSLKLVAGYSKGLDSATRALRKQLKGRALQDPRATLLEILESCDDNPAAVHSLLQEAARQARNEGDDSEHLFFRRQLKLLWKEHSQPLRGAANPARHRQRPGTRAPYLVRPETMYSATVSAPLNVLGLVEALLSEMREHGQFETSLRDMRSDMAAHLAWAVSSNVVSQTRPLMSGLVTARYVAALLSECEHLLGRMRRKNSDLRIEAVALLRHLLTLIGTLMDPEQTRTLVELIGGKHLRNQLACLNELKRILNERLPVQLLRTKNGFSNLRENLLILSTVLTNEEQQLLQEDSALWNA